jgi:hypothetical protein
MGPYTVTRADGTMVAATRLPLPRADPLVGYHRRVLGQRLDLIASHYLSDPTTFWRLCDVNDTMVPDALGAHDLVGIPRKGR